jgi:hypothetical protein
MAIKNNKNLGLKSVGHANSLFLNKLDHFEKNTNKRNRKDKEKITRKASYTAY